MRPTKTTYQDQDGRIWRSDPDRRIGGARLEYIRKLLPEAIAELTDAPLKNTLARIHSLDPSFTQTPALDEIYRFLKHWGLVIDRDGLAVVTLEWYKQIMDADIYSIERLPYYS